MNALNEQKLQGHVPIVAWLLIIFNALMAAVGVFAGGSILLVAPTLRWTQGLAFPVLMIVMAVPGLVAGFGLLGRKAWARVLGILGCVLDVAGVFYAYTLGNTDLPALIVCAILGIYAIVVLAMKPVTQLRHA